MIGPVSSGDLAGTITTVVGGLVALGAGVRWALNWVARRSAQLATSREAKLQRWHDELSEREQTLDAAVLDRLTRVERKNVELEKKNDALWNSFQHVAAALIRVDPQNPALGQAEKIMAAAFPLDFTLATTRAGAALDAKEAGNGGRA